MHIVVRVETLDSRCSLCSFLIAVLKDFISRCTVGLQARLRDYSLWKTYLGSPE